MGAEQARPSARAGAGPLALFMGWMRKRRSRRALADLDDHQLADIGITRAEARDEAARSRFL